jgi:hypothetical protein
LLRLSAYAHGRVCRPDARDGATVIVGLEAILPGCTQRAHGFQRSGHASAIDAKGQGRAERIRFAAARQKRAHGEARRAFGLCDPIS